MRLEYLLDALLLYGKRFYNSVLTSEVMERRHKPRFIGNLRQCCTIMVLDIYILYVLLSRILSKKKV